MSTTTTLDSQRVQAIFLDCLFKDGEDTSKHVRAEGITMNVGFHPERLESHKAEIEALLSELPDEFKEKSGGGMSFLNACNDRHGNQWTSFHLHMDQLFQLGIATGTVRLLTPRAIWSQLPCGMPYFVVVGQ